MIKKMKRNKKGRKEKNNEKSCQKETHMHLEEGNDVCKNNNVSGVICTANNSLSCYTEIFSAHQKNDEGS